MIDFDKLNAKTQKANNLKENDFKLNGLWHCGKCRAPKQCRITWLGEPKTPFCMCKCQIERTENDTKAHYFNEIRLKNDLQLYDIWDCTFENWRKDTSSQILKACLKYVQDFSPKSKSLLFMGETGKSYAAKAIHNELKRNCISVLYTTFTRINEVKQLPNFEKYDLIIIDGKIEQNEAICEMLKTRIKPVIFTTDLTFEQMEAEQLEIYSLIVEKCYPVVFERG